MLALECALKIHTNYIHVGRPGHQSSSPVVGRPAAWLDWCRAASSSLASASFAAAWAFHEGYSLKWVFWVKNQFLKTRVFSKFLTQKRQTSIPLAYCPGFFKISFTQLSLLWSCLVKQGSDAIFTSYVSCLRRISFFFPIALTCQFISLRPGATLLVIVKLLLTPVLLAHWRK